jgi:Secretion system C-terminal sorting domain
MKTFNNRYGKRGYFIVLFILSFLLELHSQQSDNWYFGNKAAIGFNNGIPVALSGSMMNATEGCATISDNSGNLLFYTNGLSVWGSNNVVMPNGSGLSSDIYATQSALIVAKPGSPSLYYLFTMNTWEFAPTNLKYSIIDMSLNNGLGDITGSKNVLVNNNTREQLTAAPHNNGTDYWIIAHEALSNNFVAYQLSDSGLSSTPVVSGVGTVYDGTNRFGALHVSHDCTKLVSVLGTTTPGIACETVQLFDFNSATGVISNAVTIATNLTFPTAYSATFSPNSSKLYVTSYNLPIINQYDLDAQNIIASQVNIADTFPGKKCGLQTGPDNKIYVGMVNAELLSVINSPDSAGLNCNYQNNSIALGTGKYCRLGLPNNYYMNCQVVSSVTENSFASFQLFPNPASDKILIELNSGAQITNVSVVIHNQMGEMVYYSNFKEEKIEVNCADFVPGIYFVTVQNGNIRSGKKFVRN